MGNSRLKIAAAALLMMIGGFLVPAWSPAQAAGEPLRVRVGLYDNKPKLWKDNHGVAQGLFPDVMNAIAKMEGWQVEYVYGTWDEGLKRLETHEIDIMPDVALSDERQRLYDFNRETILISWGIFYTRPGVTISSIRDLAGKRIAVMKDGILYNGPLGLKNLLDSFGLNSEIIDVKVYDDVFDLLNKGQADVGVVNQAYGIANEMSYNVRRTSVVFYPSELRFALTKGATNNAHLIDRIDTDLKLLKSDNRSAYHRSLVRYFGGLVERVEVFPRWFKYLALGLLIAFAIVLSYILVLRAIRRRLEALVEARTADLRREKEGFQSIFEGSNDAIVLLDTKDLLILECNDAAWKNLGYAEKDSLIGKSPLEFSVPIQADGRPSLVVLKEDAALALKKGRAFFDWTCRHVNGTEIFSTVVLTPLDWGGKKVVHVALRDVTEQKLAQEKVLSLDRLKGRFITILSHVIRTPLTRIRWSLESLESGDFGQIEESGRALIRQALDGNTVISRVITNMNTTLDIERGALSLDPLPSSLEYLVGSVVKQFKSMPDCQDTICQFDAPKELLPLVNMDLGKMRTVIYGLLDNARRFMPEEKREVHIEFRRESGWVRCSITDDGIGIPEAEQRYIFERFFRASNASLKHPDGVGLGLYIAKSIIEKHGGRMGFESTEGKGSTFWFELPAIK